MSADQAAPAVNDPDEAPGVSARPRLVVGVGASAGGLDAFRTLLGALPADTGMAFILVQHLDPTHESLLVDLLQPCTEMAVREAEDGARLERDVIHVIPPDASLAVRDGRIVLSSPSLRRGVRLPVDHLFRSLAGQYGPRAAAVVLSGAGSDGSAGLRDVKAAGGLTVAQTPTTSAHDGMPGSAIDTGAVELIVDIEAMPAALERFASLSLETRRRPADDDDDDADPGPDGDVLERLSTVLEAHLDFDLRAYKPGTIERRIARRMGLSGFTGIDAYIAHLRADPVERRTLVREMLINITDFFREPASFSALRELVVEPLLDEVGQGSPIRVWVPGCATGEEAWSIGILFLEACAESGRRVPIQIFATDVDAEAVAVGRAAIYPDAVATRISADRLKRYFERLSGKGYRIRRPLRDMVSFATHDLTRDPPFSRMDLISCRNVLIYLNPTTQARVLQLLHFGLKPDGCLMLSTSESSGPQRELFSTVSKSQRIYRKVGVSRAVSVARARQSRSTRGFSGDPAGSGERQRVRRTEDAARKAVLAAWAPPTVLVGEDGGVRFMHGELGPWLRFPQGDDPRLEIDALLRPEIATRVRGAIYKCRRTGEETVALSSPDGGRARVRVTVRPAPAVEPQAVMLSFEPIAPPQARQAEPRSDADDEALIDQLERELAATREDLHNAVEELETSNEELRSAHEESMSMNEELQSANEELEATSEELRSLNEELTTVNAQLREKVEQLERAHADLNNLFASTRSATLFLDEGLYLQRFTPAAGRLLGIDHADRGRRVGDIARELLQDDLVEEAGRVLDHLASTSKEVRTSDGRWIERRVLPYRTERRRIEGVVVTFNDVTELRAANESLGAKSRRLELAWEAARGGIYEHRVPVDDRTHLSDQWARVLGYRRDELPEPAQFLTWLVEQIHEDDRERVTASYRDFVDGRVDHHDVELRVCHRAGQWLWVRALAEALDRDADGRVTHLLGMMMDITSHKRTEDALRESEGRFRSLAESLPLMVWVHDSDGQQEYVNEAFCDFFAVERDDMVGARWQTLVHPEQAHEVSEVFYACVREQRPFHMESTVRAADGEWRQIESWGQPRIGASGEVYGFVGASADITARRAIEDALRESEARFRLLGDNMAQLAWIADGEGRFGWFNQRWYLDTGTDAEQMNAEGLRAVLDPDEADAIIARMTACFERGEVWEDTFAMRSADGGFRWYLSRAVPIRDDDGALIRWLGTHTDVTERRATRRRLVEADRQKNEFLAMLGHELRNPLAVIRSATDLLARIATDDSAVARAQSILARQTRHMSTLLDGLLDVSRIIRGRIELDLHEVDLRAICRETGDDVVQRTSAGAAALEMDLPDAPVLIEGDRVRLAQIVDNLLSNAFKYTPPEGRIRMRVSIQGATAVLEVSDDGVGIDPDLLPHIFKMFRQSEQSLARSAGGMGLGLALVEALTELHGGRVEAHSDGPGRGARLTVRLPLAEPSAEASMDVVVAGDATLDILIIEDNADAAALLCDVLQLEGHRVSIATRGQDGIALAHSEQPMVVVCDLGLPGGCSGFDVAQALRADADTRHIPLVALSGYGGPLDLDQSAEAGFDVHLTKPVDIDVLQETLLELRAAALARAAEAGDAGGSEPEAGDGDGAGDAAEAGSDVPDPPDSSESA